MSAKEEIADLGFLSRGGSILANGFFKSSACKQRKARPGSVTFH